ncbi:MAG: class I SAM-dependent methyltransferase [Bacillota bacterium]|nr:class I SAM-dependent methyltransferase [Bacillota bacterium]
MKNIKDFYDKTAMEWADKWYDNEILLPYLKEFMSYLPKNPRVLDLCCGAGYESMRMRKLGADVTGLDFSEQSILIAKERNPQIRFVVEDMQNDYSYLGKFDGCAVIAGLVHLTDEKLTPAFDMIYKVLNDNGFLFAAVKDGSGKDMEASFKTVDGEEYSRDFYLHTLIDLKNHSAGKFEIVKEVMPDSESLWKYYIFRKL